MHGGRACEMQAEAAFRMARLLMLLARHEGSRWGRLRAARLARVR